MNAERATESKTSQQLVRRGKWMTLTKNKWFELFELRLNDNESLVHVAFLQLDAQLGIGVAMEVGVASHFRGFEYFSVVDIEKQNLLKKVDEDSIKSLQPLLPEDPETSGYFLVRFLHEKIDDSNHVFESRLMAQLSKQSDREKAKGK